MYSAFKIFDHHGCKHLLQGKKAHVTYSKRLQVIVRLYGVDAHAGNISKNSDVGHGCFFSSYHLILMSGTCLDWNNLGFV